MVPGFEGINKCLLYIETAKQYHMNTDPESNEQPSMQMTEELNLILQQAERQCNRILRSLNHHGEFVKIVLHEAFATLPSRKPL